MRSAVAFSPAGISSFFEICDTAMNGFPIKDPVKIGARGGGFGIKKGVKTHVMVYEASVNSVEIFINGREAPDAETTREVVYMLLKKAGKCCHVIVKHEVDVPIGAGFGSSAAGALSTALALSKALDLHLTYNQIGQIAHVAEVKCNTGLGTVGPLMIGGCVITLEPGAPGVAVLDRIPITEDYVIVAGVVGAIPTKAVLSSPERRLAVNRWGRKTLERILEDPSLENFLKCCRIFAEETGFITERVHALMKAADDAGAIGVAQNMVGEAVHALTTIENAEKVAQAFSRLLPKEKILVAGITLQGARLLG
ncbi:MAG: hypothetical protein QW770_06995 [Candidatus Bathyarchaeia archaeon]